LKKKFKQNFGDFAKNYPLNPMSLPPSPEFLKFSELAPPPLARSTLVIPVLFMRTSKIVTKSYYNLEPIKLSQLISNDFTINAVIF
jgi:hypothetical protein